MTAKIRSITAFQGIKTPLLSTERGFIPDFQSRYFLEDFPYGLCIIKGLCEIVRLDTPSIDKILKWFQKIARVQYYIDDRFVGVGLKNLPIPQNSGIRMIEDIISYYG